MVSATKNKILIRKTTFQDATAINLIVSKCYPDVQPYPIDALRAQINHFPEGQMVVEYEKVVIGFSISFISTTACTWPGFAGCSSGVSAAACRKIV